MKRLIFSLFVCVGIGVVSFYAGRVSAERDGPKFVTNYLGEPSYWATGVPAEPALTIMGGGVHFDEGWTIKNIAIDAGNHTVTGYCMDKKGVTP